MSEQERRGYLLEDERPQLRARIVELEQHLVNVKDMDALQRDLGQWSDATFGVASKSRLVGMVSHLGKEYKEILDVLVCDIQDDLVAEAVDMSLLLMDIVRVSGYSLYDEMCKKLEILQTRRWQPMAIDGSVEHVRE